MHLYSHASGGLRHQAGLQGRASASQEEYAEEQVGGEDSTAVREINGHLRTLQLTAQNTDLSLSTPSHALYVISQNCTNLSTK